MEFKDQLKKLRLEHHLTQKELADIIFVSRSAIAKYENGNGYPSPETLSALADYFHIDIKEFHIDKAPINNKANHIGLSLWTIFVALSVSISLLIKHNIESRPYVRKHDEYFYREKVNTLYAGYWYEQYGCAKLTFGGRLLGKGFEKIEIPEDITAGDALTITYIGQMTDLTFDYGTLQTVSLYKDSKILSYSFTKAEVTKVNLEEYQNISSEVANLNNQFDNEVNKIITRKIDYRFVDTDGYYAKKFYYSSYTLDDKNYIGSLYSYNPRT